jgi:hypothetical protein
MLSCLRKNESKIEEGPAELGQITFDGLCLDEIIFFSPIPAINLTKCREILYIFFKEMIRLNDCGQNSTFSVNAWPINSHF